MSKPKYIESPEKMWGLFTEYKNSLKTKPVLVHDFVGKDAESVYREKEQPLIMEGFECFVMDKGVINYPDLTEYFEGKNESYKNYFPICSRIKREIRHDQLRLGMLNLINPSITQRLNGLVEKTEDVTPQQPKKLVIKIKRDEDN